MIGEREGSTLQQNCCDPPKKVNKPDHSNITSGYDLSLQLKEKWE